MTTERIDVLAVMDKAARDLWVATEFFANKAAKESGEEMAKARAAVAELIEAAKLLNCELPSPADAEVDYAGAIDRFVAALARAGGA